MRRQNGRMPADRVMRRRSLALGGGAVLLGAPGAAIGNLWLLGAGVWLLIAAFLVELVYRP
ncbi:hypothetical protein AB0M42_13990 [Streptomyces sp. NPDC051784]|uniref:hypothetical protein n=1 Tax=Streptomyces sp. NPDC051784 TaxID=3155805 RepID=UPI003415E1E4